MPEKIKLSDSQSTQLDLIPNGISTDNTTNIRKFMFRSSITYSELLTLFNSPANIKTIAYILADGSTGTTYTDCVELKSLSYDITGEYYTAELSIDAVEKALQSMNAQIDDLSNTIVMMSML